LYSLWISIIILIVLCRPAKGEQNPYEELRAVKTEFAGFKAHAILSLDLEIHEADSALKNIEYIYKLAKEKNDKNLTSIYYETLAQFFSLRYDRINSLATMNHAKAIQFAQENSLEEHSFRQNFTFGNYYFTYAKYADAY